MSLLIRHNRFREFIKNTLIIFGYLLHQIQSQGIAHVGNCLEETQTFARQEVGTDSKVPQSLGLLYSDFLAGTNPVKPGNQLIRVRTSGLQDCNTLLESLLNTGNVD
jgi:hypothetical protein